MNGVLENTRPLQVRKVDPRLQLALDDSSGVEVEHGCLVGAVCDILTGGGSEVRDGCRRVVPLAVVKDVCRIEVLDVEFFGNVGDGFVEILLDGGFDALKDLG